MKRQTEHTTLRWTPENIAKLGREPDKAIADSLGITVSAVGIRRRKLGIPPLAKPQPRWTKAMISRLGKEPDAVIASTYDLGFLAVYRKRRSLGIPGCRKK
jgi:hypothetical protein